VVTRDGGKPGSSSLGCPGQRPSEVQGCPCRERTRACCEREIDAEMKIAGSVAFYNKAFTSDAIPTIS
jgi:hypothetical protein